MNMNRWKVYATVIACMLFGWIGVEAHASEFNFAVTPTIPENQVDKSKTYFDLKMAPGAKQTVEIQLRNDTDEDITIENTVNSATTNLNGVVEYGQNGIKPDKTLRFNLKDYVEAPKEIILPKHSQKTLPLTITMPKDSFDGVMAGGITLKEKKKETTTSADQSKGLAINNEYSYVVAIILQQNETKVQPDLKLLGVKPGQVNARNVINVSLQNPQAAYLNQLHLINTVSKGGETLYQSDTEDMQVAPNSNFSYPISLKGERLTPGKYVLKSTAYGVKDEKGIYQVKGANGEERYLYKWEFTKEFTISGDVAKELNEKDVTIKGTNWWLYLLIVLIILALLLLIFFLYRKKKKEEEQQSE
ncbi:TPA: DUF916 and DUF3324 domain-containing protein [Enterococcus faecalis]|nr:DUF916 and DUF3324 domain-containing protein [Enterococcus faecalis]